MGWVDDIEKALNSVLPSPPSSKKVELASVEQANKLVESIRATNDASVSSAGLISSARAQRPSTIIELPIGLLGGSINWVTLPPGKALVLLRETSAPGITFTVELDDITYTRVPIGSRINTPWDKGRILIDYPNQLSNMGYDYGGLFGRTSSNVRAVIVNDTFDIVEPQIIPDSRGYFTGSTTQNSAASNPPSSVTDYTLGYSVDGCKRLRVYLEAASSYFNGNGSLRLWKVTQVSNGDETPKWAMAVDDVKAMTNANGFSSIMFDFEVKVPIGRVFPECVNITTAVGTPTIKVVTEVSA